MSSVDGGPALHRARFYDRECLNVLYRTAPEALAAVIPEPLQFDDPLAGSEMVQMGDVAGHGPRVEASRAIPMTFEGEKGEYLQARHLDELEATPPDERWGASTPSSRAGRPW